ncbi:MAG TPA: phosphoribosyltransferase [Tangfeifania sp.]|nr:phosphoribosyltransferase [Tangfeifania sp.]
MEGNKKQFTAQLVSLQEVYNSSLKLAEKIKASSIQFDAIVSIARGGFPPARFLCDFLNIERLYSVQIKHYARGAEQQEEAEVLNKSLGDIENRKILLADDVNDSGKSLKTALELLEPAALIKTAVLHEKETSEIKADFAGERFSEWKWFIYPWARTEDVLEFLSRGNMLNKGIRPAINFLKEKYDLKIEEGTLREIFQFKPNYF